MSFLVLCHKSFGRKLVDKTKNSKHLHFSIQQNKPRNLHPVVGFPGYLKQAELSVIKMLVGLIIEFITSRIYTIGTLWPALVQRLRLQHSSGKLKWIFSYKEIQSLT